MEPSSEVIAVAAAGRKIEAIKLLRREQGIGLAEAKAVVDALPAGSNSDPTTRSAGQEDRGTARFVMALVIIGIVAAALYFLQATL